MSLFRRKDKQPNPDRGDDFSIGQQPDGEPGEHSPTLELEPAQQPEGIDAQRAAEPPAGEPPETAEPAAADADAGADTEPGSARELYGEQPPQKRGWRDLLRGWGKKRIVLASVAALVVLCMLTSAGLYFGGVFRGAGGAAEITPLLSSAAYQKVSYQDLPTGAQVLLQGSSVEEDITIRVCDIEGAQITGVAFEFTITGPDEEPFTVVDEEMAGEVHVEGLASGVYIVEMQQAEDFQPTDPIAVEVAPKVEYKKIENVTIVKQSDVDVANDDPQYGSSGSSGGTTTPPPLTNTVEYIESKTEQKTTTTETVVGYTYKPDGLGEGGELLLADGSVSDVFAVLDANGYLTGGYRKAAENPELTEVVPVFDAAGEPVKDTSGAYIYKILVEEIKENVETVETIYYGWQTIDGKTYYFDKNGAKVTGTQVIQGVQYAFNSDGSLNTSTGNKGIDVSTWQGSIDWAKVKASGVSFVFIRAGFRGYGSGKIVEDDMFRANMAGATAAGLKVGVYFFTQAINTYEAVEEASAVLDLIRGYNVTYPIAIDIEYCGSSSGRTVGLTTAERTRICIAFCDTIRSAGYTPMIYANKNWLETMLDTSQFGGYLIWLAHFTTAAQSSYKGRYEIWQYSSTGSVPGISGNVDMNISYMGY